MSDGLQRQFSACVIPFTFIYYLFLFVCFQSKFFLNFSTGSLNMLYTVYYHNRKNGIDMRSIKRVNNWHNIFHLSFSMQIFWLLLYKKYNTHSRRKISPLFCFKFYFYKYRTLDVFNIFLPLSIRDNILCATHCSNKYVYFLSTSICSMISWVLNEWWFIKKRSIYTL